MKKPGLQELNIQVDTEATPDTLLQRDSSGRAKVAPPAVENDIATKGTVDAHANLLEIHRKITFGTANPTGGSNGDIYFQYE
ncbi:hypothetical protein ACPT9H_00485 [Brevibacillus borstelensis]|jgi:hypothetical protein|uniref:hypothetical protein n=1 Tax=Brevibacillus borstelensis TaxID=45462 RepID=UPI003CE4842C